MKQTAENDGRVDDGENQRQLSHRRPRCWKSLARFPHSHSRGVARKSGKRKRARLPLSRLLLGNQTNQKGGLAPDRFAPAFRLIVRLENAAISETGASR